MPLKNCHRGFIIDPQELWGSPLLKGFEIAIKIKSFNMVKRVSKDFVAARDPNVSAGYFKYAMLFGFYPDHLGKDVNHVRDRLKTVFGTSAQADEHINKCCGTILMATTAEDPRFWYYKEDPEKKQKKIDLEIPLPNEYWIGKPYKIKPPTKAIVVPAIITANGLDLTKLKQSGKFRIHP